MGIRDFNENTDRTMPPKDRRFTRAGEAICETTAWTHNEWLSRPELVDAKELLLVRATMPPMHCHPFHVHTHREEITYVISGRAEQWVDGEYRILQPGEMAHIPVGKVHATYNPHPEPLVFLAILSPALLPEAEAAVPDPMDVSSTAPWNTIRNGMVECTTIGPMPGTPN